MLHDESIININKFQREHLKIIAVNTSVSVLLAFTEIILLKKNKLTLLMMIAVNWCCFQSFLGLGISGICIQQYIVGSFLSNVYERFKK